MIYRLYFNTGATSSSPNIEHRYCEFLLEYALFHEQQLIYRDQTIFYNEWHKPALSNYPQIQYNVSHCKGLASCVLADVPVGIDVEYIRPFSMYVARRICTPREMDDIQNAEEPNRQFFIYWTLKESCVKAMGTGLTYPLKQVVFHIAEQDIHCLTRPEYQFLLLENAGQYITAVCYRHIGKSVRVYEDIEFGGS